MKLRVIVTGVTGMVGESVLHECLQHPGVESVLAVTRQPTGVQHPKLKEIVHADFFNLSPIRSQLAGYNACFFCLGVTSIGKDEATYTQLTHTLTLHFAQTLVEQSPETAFCYISGAGTDSTEKGRSMWARVKGRTENDLMKLPFRDVYAFRPGMLRATKGMKHTLPAYKWVAWLYPPARAFGVATTLKELGLAMIRVAQEGYPKKIIGVREIIALAKAP